MYTVIKGWLDRYFSNPQVVILGFILLVGTLCIYLFGDLLTPLLVALVGAYLLDGLVGLLQRLGVPRTAAVVIVFLIFMGCVVLTLGGLLPLLSRQVGQLLADLPKIISKGQAELIRLPEKYPQFVTTAQINDFLRLLTAELTSAGQHLLSLSLASVRNLLTIVVYLVLVPLLVFFFLKDKQQILKWGSAFLPSDRALSNRVWVEVNQQIANYIRGKLWEILIVWMVSWAAFSILQLKYAMLLSFFTGLSVLIPYVGAFSMTIPVALVAYFQWGLAPRFTWTVIVYTIIQILDGNVLVPLLLSGVVNIHPVAIILALLVFGGAWGMLGLFFAIPLATLIHAVIKAWQESLKEQTAEDEGASA